MNTGGEQVEPPPPAPAPAPAPALGGRGPAAADLLAQARILVADDDPSNLLVVDRLLRSAGVVDVHQVQDARQVADRCVQVQPDLLLLDLHMPHLDGVEVLDELHQVLAPDTFLPVIVVTADVTDDARHRALQAGAKDHLTKPLDRDELLLRLGNHLETAALYRQVQGENRRLQAELDEQDRSRRAVQDELQQIESKVRRVLDEGAVEMVFQPVVDLGSGRVVALEALARFPMDPVRAPDTWFADAARVGLELDLELAAARAALGHLPELAADLLLAVNVSPHVAMTDAFREAIAPVSSRRVVVELTEHLPIDDYDLVVEGLAPLRADGVAVAVDDAGAGYAGLQRLVRLRPDVVKLDRELTVGIDTDPARRAMAASMVHFAGEIGAVVVGEGIENQAAVDALRHLGVQLGQGYHLARPGPLEAAPVTIDLGASVLGQV